MKNLTLASLLVFMTLAALVVPQSRSNWWYHNDEPSKVMQVMGGFRNLRHPPLLLSMVTLLCGHTREGDEQRVVECGRLFSCACAGIALMAVMWLVALHAGPLAGFIAGLLILFQPWFFEGAHYFKEDSLFLCGLLLTLLALEYCERRGSWLAYGLLSASLALCVSGKFAGWLVVPLVGLYVFSRRGIRWNCVAAASLLFLALVLWWNWALLVNWSAFREAMLDETDRMVHGEYGLVIHSPFKDYVRLLREMIPAVAGVGYVFYALYRLWNFKKTAASEGVLLILPPVYFLAVAFSYKYSERYLYSVFLLISMTGFYGSLVLVREATRNMGDKGRICRWFAVFLIGGVLLGKSIQQWKPVYEAFNVDSRGVLSEYIRTRLPPDAVLAQDLNVKLTPEMTGGRRIEEDVFVSDMGGREGLLALGVTHVVVSYDVYHRFIDGWIVPLSGQAEDFERRKSFYLSILDNKDAICWSSPNQPPKAMHPGLTLICIKPVK